MVVVPISRAMPMSEGEKELEVWKSSVPHSVKTEISFSTGESPGHNPQ